MKQLLIWIPKSEIKEGYMVPIVPDIDFPHPEPKRLWTLYLNTDHDNPPTLPFIPKHLENGFVEDKLHDWNIKNGKLIYRSRLSDGGCWSLLEY